MTPETASIWTGLISNLGFPIVICGVLLYIVYKQYVSFSNQTKEFMDQISSLMDTHKEEMKEQSEVHRKEVDTLRQSLDNNTQILIRLDAKLGGVPDGK